MRDLPALDPEVPAILRQANDRGIPTVALCTGSFVLAAAGLLVGRRCALQFDTISTFAERFPLARLVTEANCVIDGNIVTEPASIVAVDLAMILIGHYGKAAGPARRWIT